MDGVDPRALSDDDLVRKIKSCQDHLGFVRRRMQRDQTRRDEYNLEIAESQLKDRLRELCEEHERRKLKLGSAANNRLDQMLPPIRTQRCMPAPIVDTLLTKANLPLSLSWKTDVRELGNAAIVFISQNEVAGGDILRSAISRSLLGNRRKCPNILSSVKQQS